MVSAVDNSKNSDNASTCLWTRRNTGHLCRRDSTVFYHINITQRKLTLGIKKKHLYNLYMFFFLAVLLHYTSLNRNSQVPSKTANQLPKKRSDTVVNETRFGLVLTDKYMRKLTSSWYKITQICTVGLTKKFVPDYLCRFH